LTQETAAAPTPESDPDASALALRSSTELQTVPAERDPAPARPASIQAPTKPQSPELTLASLTRLDTALPTAMALPRSVVATPPPEITWALASLELAAGVGWLYERRRRVRLETDGVPEPWQQSAPTSQRRRAVAGVDETFPEDGEIAEAARPVYVSVIGDTPSRREATLVDLHDLNARLSNLRRNHMGAAELLEQHLVDFRYTSPWVFLELRELYQHLEQREEWELVRDAFRTRFGQNAPQWNAPSTAGAEIANDKQLCADLLRKWPQREARMFILRWMLGDAQSRAKSSGPPQLALGIYRDMLLLDAILDDVMTAKPAPASPPVLATPA
jgi:hypothetical protein